MKPVVFEMSIYVYLSVHDRDKGWIYTAYLDCILFRWIAELKFLGMKV